MNWTQGQSGNPGGHFPSLRPHVVAGSELSRARVNAAALTKRIKLEEEFGMPYARARRLRQKYYSMGRESARTTIRRLENQVRRLLAEQNQRAA